MSRTSRRLLCMLSALAGFAVLPALASAQQSARPRAGLVRLGAAPASHAIALELPLRADSAGLSRFATAVSTPGSPMYGRYERVRTLSRRFGATQQTRSRVARYLRRAGAVGVRIDVTGLFADATMRAGAAQRLFGTSLDRFRAHATAASPAHTYITPAHAARVPAALRGAVTGVVGLDNRPLHPDTSPTPITSAYPTRTGSPSGCSGAVTDRSGFTPNQYLTAYGYDPLHSAGLEGQGERVALIEIDGFKMSDVKAFAACFHLAVPKISAYGVGIGKALPDGGESTLDLELLDAAAPDLDGVDVYESQPVASEVLRSLTEPLSVKGHTPNVISASLGSCEPDAQAAIGQTGLKTVESELQLAAATGISVIASSGDSGSTACLTAKGNPLDQLAVEYPASSPWVTGVGGTNVHLAADNTIADPATDQVVWNDEPLIAGAGGGGASTFAKPSYQDGFQNSGSREVPDVSMLADTRPGYEIYCTASTDCGTGTGSHPWVALGGTSAGTPLLAGGLALVDQELRERGQQSVGFANPLLYKIADSSASALTLSDVVAGSNDLSGSIFGQALGCCSAATGYDEASGLGSVNMSGLATAAATLVPKEVRVSVSVPAQADPVSQGHLLATVSCSGECLMGAYAKIAFGSSGTITAFSQPYQLTNRHRRTIRIGLNGSAQRKLRGALAAHEQVVATIYGAIIDANGNTVRKTAGQQLRIRG